MAPTPPVATPETPPALKIPDPAAADPEAPLLPSDLSKFADEWAGDGTPQNPGGKLSDDSYAELKTMGFSKELVDQYCSSVVDQGETQVQKIYNAAGGQQNIKPMMEWASTSLEAGAHAAFNTQLESADFATRMAAVQSLHAMWKQSGAAGAPPVVEGSPVTGLGPVYESTQQFLADIGKPEYQNDPAFRAKVIEKLGRSPDHVMGTSKRR